MQRNTNGLINIEEKTKYRNNSNNPYVNINNNSNTKKIKIKEDYNFEKYEPYHNIYPQRLIEFNKLKIKKLNNLSERNIKLPKLQLNKPSVQYTASNKVKISTLIDVNPKSNLKFQNFFNDNKNNSRNINQSNLNQLNHLNSFNSEKKLQNSIYYFNKIDRKSEAYSNLKLIDEINNEEDHIIDFTKKFDNSINFNDAQYIKYEL